VGAYACAIDDPSTVDVSGGSLNLTVRRLDTPYPCAVPYPGSSTPFVAGTVSTVGVFSQQYGRFEARIRDTATTMPGLHEAFWMWPVQQGLLPWPSSGEIDVSETYSVYPDRSFPYLHSTMDLLGPRPGVNTAMNCAAQRGAWNTYTLEWTPTLFEFFVNGRPCLVTGSGDAAFQKAYFPILTQALGQYNDSYDGRAPLPATMNVDYVKAWK
jgi:beta-glucanase (GH16 family)